MLWKIYQYEIRQADSIASACACSDTDSASVASFSPKTVRGINLTLAQISNSTETETRFTIARWSAIFCISILVRQQFQGYDHEFQLMLFLRFLRVLRITWLPRPPFLLKGKISSISPYTRRTKPFIDSIPVRSYPWCQRLFTRVSSFSQILAVTSVS